MSKFILVTGAHTGIGYHSAKLLNQSGFSVITTVRHEGQISSVSDFSQPILCDLSSQQQIDRLVRQVAIMSSGRLWGIFNNAAYGQPGALLDLNENTLLSQLDVNLVSQHSITRKLIPFMIGEKGARLLFNSSVLGITHMPLRGAYTISKYALEALAATYRIELKRFGIHVSVIRPGPIATHFKVNAFKAFNSNIDTSNSLYKEQYEKMTARLNAPPSHKTLLPESVAKKVLHAFTARTPKNYYRSTLNTYATELAIRTLPSSIIDRLVIDEF